MKTDGLDALGNPEIRLPDDLGDGPFWTVAPDASLPLPEMAETTARFERSSAFEETLLTDNPIMGPSSRIIVGQIHISDKIGPESFRRVHQHFSLRHVGAISGYPVIVFDGDPGAIIREEMGHFKPNKPATGNDLLNGAKPSRGNVPEARNSRDPSRLYKAWESYQKAEGTLKKIKSELQPSLSLRASIFQIRFRLPKFEPLDEFGITSINGPVCISPYDTLARTSEDANQIEEFLFGNEGGQHREFLLKYPVGDSVPLIFDIVNHNPTHAVRPAFTVSVYIQRSRT